MEFQKISSPSLKELFVQQLEHMILSGQLQVGDKLPPERHLSNAMQVSRAVVNGGITELERKGFLVVKPRSGTFVADYRKNGTLETLTAIMQYNGGRLRNSEVRSIFEVRIALDIMCARLCVATISDEEIGQLEECLNRIKAAASAQEAAEASFDFQHTFATISGNSLIPMMFYSFRAPIFTMWERYYNLYGIEDLYQSNQRLFNHIKSRDVEGTIKYIEASMAECINGKREIYFT